MEKTYEWALAFAVAVAASGVAAFQAPVNSLLGGKIGIIQANFFSNVIGTAALALVMALIAPCSFTFRFWTTSLSGLPGILWIGGLLGSLYMVASTVLVKRLGALGWVSAAFMGQIVTGIVVDHFGLFGVTQVHIEPRRLLGVALLLAGAYLAIARK